MAPESDESAVQAMSAHHPAPSGDTRLKSPGKTHLSVLTISQNSPNGKITLNVRGLVSFNWIAPSPAPPPPRGLRSGGAGSVGDHRDRGEAHREGAAQGVDGLTGRGEEVGQLGRRQGGVGALGR